MSARDRKVLEAKAKRLAQKFVDDVQALLEDERMTDDIYDTEIFDSLVCAQGSAEDVVNG